MLRSLATTRAIPFFLFILFGALYLTTARGVVFCNDGSQMALVRAIGEKQSFAINAFVHYTQKIDYAFRNGNYFSDRPIGTSLLALPFYIATYATLTALGLSTATVAVASEASAALSICLYGALGVSLLYLLLESLGISRRSAFITALAYGGASLHWKYSALFMSHSPSATTLILLLWLLFKPSPERFGVAFFFILGCLPLIRTEAAILIPFLLLIWFVRGTGDWKYGKFSSLFSLIIALTWFTFPLLFLALYNTECFGGPLTTFNGFYSPDRNFFGTDSIFGKAGGAFSYTEIVGSSLFKGFNKLFFQFPGHSDLSPAEKAVLGAGGWGIFILHPVLLLSLLGIAPLLKKLKKEGIILCSMLLASLIFIASLRILDGGGMRDPRFILMVLPLFYLLLAFAAEKLLWTFGTIRAGMMQSAFWVLATISLGMNIIHLIESDEKRPPFDFHNIQATSLISKEFFLPIARRLFLNEMDFLSAAIITIATTCLVITLLAINKHLSPIAKWGIPLVLSILIITSIYTSYCTHAPRIEQGTIQVSGHVATLAVQEVSFPRRVVARASTSIASCDDALIVQPHSLVIIPLQHKTSLRFVTSIKVKKFSSARKRTRVRFTIRGDRGNILWQSSRVSTADMAQFISLPLLNTRALTLEVTRAHGWEEIEARWCNPKILPIQ